VAAGRTFEDKGPLFFHVLYYTKDYREPKAEAASIPEVFDHFLDQRRPARQQPF
jgi:hypothetical protein